MHTLQKLILQIIYRTFAKFEAKEPRYSMLMSNISDTKSPTNPWSKILQIKRSIAFQFVNWKENTGTLKTSHSNMSKHLLVSDVSTR